MLTRVKLDSFLTCAFDVGGKSAIVFPRAEALRFKVILQGECWLSVEGDDTCYRLRAGDCFLVSHGRSFVLSTRKSDNQTVYAENLIHSRNEDGVIVHEGGGDILSIGSVFKFQGHFSRLILKSLPPVIHLPSDLDQAAVLRWSLERFGAEFRGTAAGRALMMGNLAPIILLQTLRVYARLTPAKESWLIALSHPKLSKAIEAMHADCGRKWTVASLAAISGMSRAGFAQNFKKYVGAAPKEYLLYWRMQVACNLLEKGELASAEIAHEVGYESESAFSSAFKKVLGLRPGRYVSDRTGLA
ncbi:AraC-like DNA-binding protein [Rhizobium halophytocola]|uniref:AraC-like DNA-binding protein n=1 Tax=Rhizobium halophytocola TaxID=735519 RepID=A0ABS4E5R7_9HYPH|nr:AraC-like DNA-binding protein [Rhizobium halophytocola]